MYVTAIASTMAAWFVGLVLDVNIHIGNPLGFACLRILFPIIAMGLCILKAVKGNEKP